MTTLLAIAASTTAFVPAPEPKITVGQSGDHATVAIVQHLPYPAERVWEVVGDWGNAHVGKGFVERVEISGRSVGDTRTLFLLPTIGGGSVAERLEAYDAKRMTYSYTIIDYGALPWEDYAGRFVVVAAGPCKSTILFEARMVPVGVKHAEAAQLSVSNMRAYLGNLSQFLGGNAQSDEEE